MKNIISFFYTFFFLDFSKNDSSSGVSDIIKVLEPVFDVVMGVLYFILICTVIYKIVLLAKDLAQASDEPEKRAEIKKAFFYSLAAPVIAAVASPLVHTLMKVFIFNK